jgi:hypothetical protein
MRALTSRVSDCIRFGAGPTRQGIDSERDAGVAAPAGAAGGDHDLAGAGWSDGDLITGCEAGGAQGLN